MQPRVEIAHDYVTQPGGAERVVLAMLRAFPGASLTTSVYEPGGTFPEFGEYDIRTSPLQRVGVFRRDPRRALPLLAPTFDRLRVEEADAVLVSSSGWAHGIATGAPKIVYCHNPPRWLYQPADYLNGQPAYVRAGLAALSSSLRRWDQRAARSAARYLANSRAVAERVWKAYRIESEVLPPPVMVDPDGKQESVRAVEPGFLVTVSRGRGYKNISTVAAAVADHLPGERLVVVGDAVPRVRDERVMYVGRVTDAQLRWLYANARALVSVSREDFGLTPLEANAFGTPSVLLRAGGFLDTLVEGVNGVFVEEATPEAVAAAIRSLDLAGLDPLAVRSHAGRFGEDAFADRLRTLVADVLS